VYNTAHGITPKTIIKKISDITSEMRSEHDKAVDTLVAVDASEITKDPKRRRKIISEKEKQMKEAVQTLDFETAALLRDEIQAIKKLVVKRPKEPTKKKTK
jgi:excinuclease ABC subunit B